MNFVSASACNCAGGIRVDIQSTSTAKHFLAWLAQKGLTGSVKFELSIAGNSLTIDLALQQSKMDQWTPERNTLELANRLALTADRRDDLEREILIALLASPVFFHFPTLAELESSIRVRANIVEAARKTFLSFAAYEAERPADYWLYDEDRGFVVRPGKCLIEALRKATHPPAEQAAFSFSCYRATEYVIALALAEEAQLFNPSLLQRFQRQAEQRAIKSGEFHRVFMREYGSREQPLPAKYYVPGDRVWFRNPDAASSDATGFEGSWVFYLGNGLFSDFWKRGQTFTLAGKCLEIYHWRHATYRDETGDLRIDEKRVLAGVKSSQDDPREVERILSLMTRMQDARGIYAHGGCMDPTREYPRCILPGTCDIQLPDVVDAELNDSHASDCCVAHNRFDQAGVGTTKISKAAQHGFSVSVPSK
jgi:hypothetical protein